MRMRAAVSAAAIALAGCGLAGCSQPSTPEPAPAWTAPAWFATQIKAQEEAAARLQACMNAKGWHVTMDSWGGIAEGLSKDDAERAGADSRECQKENGLDTSATVTDDAFYRARYSKEIDVYKCLLSHGFVPKPPPAEDVYVDAMLSNNAKDPNAWTAWSSDWVMNAMDAGKLNDKSMAVLQLACPQPWP